MAEHKRVCLGLFHPTCRGPITPFISIVGAQIEERMKSFNNMFFFDWRLFIKKYEGISHK